MPRTLKWRLVPLVVLAAIFTIPIVQHNWRLHSLNQTAQAIAAQPATRTYISGQPSRIVVPNAAIDLSVVPGAQDIRTKIWSVSSTSANYASITAPANNRGGQTLIYGHATGRVFGPLLGLKLGDEAIVYTGNHHTFIYSYTGSHDVTPDRGDIFTAMKRGTGLVLMTCDGDQFQYRHLMSFRLEKAS